MEVYLAIWEDRHIDTQIEVFQKYNDAWEEIQIWMSEYPKYKDAWEEENIGGWEYFVKSKCDDGPTMRIEKKTLY